MRRSTIIATCLLNSSMVGSNAFRLSTAASVDVALGLALLFESLEPKSWHCQELSKAAISTSSLRMKRKCKRRKVT